MRSERSLRTSVRLFALGVSIGLAQGAWAQPGAGVPQRPEQVETVELGELVGSAQPDPPLKYLFAPQYRRRVNENSVVHYLRALGTLSALDRNGRLDSYPFEDEWLSLPIDQLPLEDVSRFLELTDDVYAEVRQGSFCREVDWQISLDESMSLRDLIEINLDDIQNARCLARYLTLKTRYEIVRGDFDAAAETMTVAFVLGEDVSQVPLLISGLVGIAIDSIAVNDVASWIATPDSPNLYWALTSLGDSPIDIVPAMLGEMRTLTEGIEAFRSPETRQWSAERWMESLTNDLHATAFLVGNGQDQEPVDRFAAGAIASAMVFADYPIAKEALLEDGFTAEQIQAMPTPQVVCIHQSRLTRRMMQQQIRWQLLRSGSIERHMADEVQVFRDAMADPQKKIGLVFLGLLMPALRQSSAAEVRLNRYVAAARTLEAVRLHVADTGQVPASLEEITIVDVPDDPMTGRPFAYAVDDATATLVMERPYVGLDRRIYRWTIPESR